MDSAYQTALDDVRARVKASGSSFTAGMILLPQERRNAMFGLYAFCREVDDIADDSPSLRVAQEGLSLWRKKISALFKDDGADHAITQVLEPAISLFGLVEEDFQTIIDGMAMDAENAIKAPSLETLDLYCDRVASAVGRVSVRIFGDASPCGMKVAFHLGRALQLTNILRDIGEDATRGRLYLPAELLEKNGITERNPSLVLSDPSLPLVCREIASMARERFADAFAAMKECRPGTMRPARVMGTYYQAILDKLEKEDWQDPTLRVKLGKAQKLALVFKALLGIGG